MGKSTINGPFSIVHCNKLPEGKHVLGFVPYLESLAFLEEI
jgi:hypothetical protein